MAAQTATISGGAITVTGSWCIVSAESDMFDTLETINGGVAGQFLVLNAAAEHEVAVSTNGNIRLHQGNGVSLTNISSQYSQLMLMYDGTFWQAQGPASYNTVAV